MDMKAIDNKKLLWVVIALVVLSLLEFYSLIHQPTDKPPKKKEHAQSRRAAYHFTAPDHWKNDPQRPIYVNGKYHYYYLYNKDYPKGNGTEWRHAVSQDLVHWKDEGVAIPKYTNENGDPWSGSVVIDKKNSAAFGKNAWIAILTQPSKDGSKQEQFLWYSTDNGKTFKSYSDKPVMTNPGTKDFRDPKIIWDTQHNKWVMTIAEGNKIGFYESSNLKDWKYTSGFSTENLGVLECPDLYMMRADDGTMKWVLGVSANGSTIGEPNTYAYWTGSFDGNTFAPDQEKPQWLDHGFDWYGGVTFEDGAASDPYEKRYAFAWMNNWAYPHNTPTLKEGFNGMDSVTREIKLISRDGGAYYLASQPVKALEDLKGKTKTYEKIEVDGSKALDVKADIYQLETDITWKEAKNIGLRLRESDDKKRHIDVGINAADQYSYVNRSFTDHPDKENKFSESKAPFDAAKKKVHLKVIVDKTSIEVFVDDGKAVHSNLVFPRFEDEGISLFSDDRKATFDNLKVSHLKGN